MSYFNINDDIIETGTYEHGTNKVPSVTQVLHHIHEDYIANWANSLGFKGIGYRKELNRYATEGTKVHNEIENFLRNGSPMVSGDNISMGFASFLKWFLDAGVKSGKMIIPLMLEQSFIGKYFCGTIDAVLQIGDKIHIVDYKTSSTIGYKYFIQLAAYKYMLDKAGLPCDYLTVLQLDKYKANANQYSISIKDNAGLLDELFNAFVYTLESMVSINTVKEIKVSDFKFRSSI